MKRTSILALGTGILLCVGLLAPGCGDDTTTTPKRDAGSEVGGLDGPKGTGGTIGTDGPVIPGLDGPKGTGGSIGVDGPTPPPAEAGAEAQKPVVEAGAEAQQKLDVPAQPDAADAPPPVVDAPPVVDIAPANEAAAPIEVGAAEASAG